MLRILVWFQGKLAKQHHESQLPKHLAQIKVLEYGKAAERG